LANPRVLPRGSHGTGRSDSNPRQHRVPVTGNPAVLATHSTLVVAVPSRRSAACASRAGMVAAPRVLPPMSPSRCPAHVRTPLLACIHVASRVALCAHAVASPACPAASVPLVLPAHVPLSLCCLSCAWGNHHCYYNSML